MNGINIGDTVRWVSGASWNHNKEKVGKVLHIIPKNARGHRLLPEGISKGQIKFQSINIVSDRFLVAVPRGGRSQLVDYYAPPMSWPSKEGESHEHLQSMGAVKAVE